MKSKFGSFVAGALVAALIGTASMTALAADGTLTLNVSPIKVLVNGEEFKPTDVNGEEVLVFTYNGTTYAPLRALAEAYGLEVGYDSEKHIATVTDPDVTQPQDADDFLSQWTIKEKPVTNYGSEKVYTVKYSGSLGMEDFKKWWKSFDFAYIKSCAEQIATDAQSLNPGYTVTAYFSYGQYNLGTAFAESNWTGSNFDAAGVWIK